MEDQAERENRDKRRTLKKGTCVQVAACMGFEEEHPETHIAIGIIDEDGEETYIENGVNLVSHLKVKKDGRYRVFLENLGAKKSDSGWTLYGDNGRRVEERKDVCKKGINDSAC